jgi:hypothetical protein
VAPEVRGRVFAVKGFFFTAGVMCAMSFFWFFQEFESRAWVADRMSTLLWLSIVPIFLGSWMLDVALYTNTREVKPAGLQELVAYSLARVIGWLLCKLYWRISYKGLEKLPRKGAILLAPNHGSFIDPIWAGCGLPRRVQYLMHASY